MNKKSDRENISRRMSQVFSSLSDDVSKLERIQNIRKFWADYSERLMNDAYQIRRQLEMFPNSKHLKNSLKVTIAIECRCHAYLDACWVAENEILDRMPEDEWRVFVNNILM